MADRAVDPRVTIIPTLKYRDTNAAIAWLCEAFGFEQRLAVPGPDGVIVHARLTFGNGMVMISSVRDSEYDRFVRPARGRDDIGTQSPYVLVADVEHHHRRALAAGAEVVIALCDQPHGGQAYSCRDPEGHLWNFGSHDPWVEPQ